LQIATVPMEMGSKINITTSDRGSFQRRIVVKSKYFIPTREITNYYPGVNT
jgi:hypothetical protein